MSRTENCEWCLTPHDPVTSECPEDDTFDVWTNDEDNRVWKKGFDDPFYKYSTERYGDDDRCMQCSNWHSTEECP